MLIASRLSVLLLSTCVFVAACSGESDTLVAAAGSGGSGSGSSSASSVGGAGQGGSGGCSADADCSALSVDCHKGQCLQGQCVQGLAADGVSCDDGLFCTGSDACVAGACKGGPTACPSDEVVCHVPTCDETNTLCGIAVAADGMACGDPCTVNGTCSGGTCQAGVPPDCSALSNACAFGVCDSQQGCTAMPINEGAPCSDDDACTGNDQCESGSCKAGAAVVACGPGDGCCPANCTVGNDGDCSNTFELTQMIDGRLSPASR